MTAYQRYALYYLPEPGALADFGARWLGWDTGAGIERAHPDLGGLPQPVAEITATPRKYGFHATIKPPFRLAAGKDAQGLAETAAAFCASAPSLRLDGLRLANLGRFLALVPVASGAGLAALRRLAAEAVRVLDPFRAPADAAELDRRRTAGLSAAQEDNLVRWGYPYVMEEFRFHMTLTGALPDQTARTAVEAALTPVLTPILPAPFILDSLCLAGADADGRFHLMERFRLC